MVYVWQLSLPGKAVVNRQLLITDEKIYRNRINLLMLQLITIDINTQWGLGVDEIINSDCYLLASLLDFELSQ